MTKKLFFALALMVTFFFGGTERQPQQHEARARYEYESQTSPPASPALASSRQNGPDAQELEYLDFRSSTSVTQAEKPRIRGAFLILCFCCGSLFFSQFRHREIGVCPIDDFVKLFDQIDRVLVDAIFFELFARARTADRD